MPTQRRDDVDRPRVFSRRLHRFVLLVLACVATGPSRAEEPTGAECVYVTNRASGTISVIDAATNEPTATIPIGNGVGADAIAVTPDGARLYTVNRGGDRVSVIDVATRRVITSVSVGKPERIVISPDGAFAYVTGAGDSRTGSMGNVSVIDTHTNSVSDLIGEVPSPSGMALTPDGRSLYVASSFGGTVTVIDTPTRTRSAAIPIMGNLDGIAIAPDGAAAYVVNSSYRRLEIIDTATNIVAASVPLGCCDGPVGVAVTPDGSSAYVTIDGVGANRGVAVVDLAARRVRVTVPLSQAEGIALDPARGVAYATGVDEEARRGVVFVIDLGSNAVTGRLSTSARSLSTTPNGAVLLAGDAAGVSLIDTASNTSLGRVAGKLPGDVALSADGRTAYVTSEGVESLTLIDTATNSVTRSIPVESPVRFAVDGAGNHAYVTHGNRGAPSDGVLVLDTASGERIADVPVDGPGAIAVSSDGARAYVTTLADGGALVVLDSLAAAVVATVPLEPFLPDDVTLSPDGSLAYVAPACGGVCVLDTTTNAVTRRIGLPPSVPGLFGSPTGPGRITLTRDGTRAFVATGRAFQDLSLGGTFFTIDTAAATVTGAISLRRSGARLGVRADGSRAFATQWTSIAVIDTGAQTVAGSIPVGADPSDLAIGAVPTGCRAPSPAADGQAACDDGDVCNGMEGRDATSGVCIPGTALQCDDGDPRTLDACDPISGCLHPQACAEACDDGDACNGRETCDSSVGRCVPGVPLHCDDGDPETVDICDPAGGCVHAPAPCPETCDDGDLCNGRETCDTSTGGCASGIPLQCDDDDPLTVDTCDPKSGCVSRARRPTGSGRTRIACRDGVLGALVTRDEQSETVPLCDVDGKRNRKCTYRLYVGCEPPLRCSGRIVTIARSLGRHVVRTPFGQRYVLSCAVKWRVDHARRRRPTP